MQTPAEKEKQRRYRERHHDRINAERRQRRRNDPTLRAKETARQMRWRARHPEQWRQVKRRSDARRRARQREQSTGVSEVKREERREASRLLRGLRRLARAVFRARPARRGHGMVNTPEWRSWHRMKQRCTNPRVCNFKNYGGRGIRVCREWMHDFSAFYAHVGKRPTPAHTIDRIDNDGDYEPGNVRWATPEQQAANRRNSKHVAKTLAAAA